MQAKQLVIITGISGSGKSTALNAFEDLGYFAVENLPAALVAPFVDFLVNLPENWHAQPAFSNVDQQPASVRVLDSNLKFALAVDCREAGSFLFVREAIAKLKSLGIGVTLLFFDCQDEGIIRRFQETRRPHPFLVGDLDGHTLAEALAKERELLTEFRGMADQIIDTSSSSPHDLRKIIERVDGRSPVLELTVQTFGFKYGVPHDADLVVDVRFLPNPHFVANLRELTGLDHRIVDYVFQSSDAVDFVDRYVELLNFLLPRYQKEGKRYLQIGVGCTGGRHRSVAVGQRLVERLGAAGSYKVTVRHRDVDRSSG